MNLKRNYTKVLKYTKRVGPTLIESFSKSQGIPPDDIGLIAADSDSNFGKFLFELVVGEQIAQRVGKAGLPYLIPIQLCNLIDIAKKFFPRLVRRIEQKRRRFQVVVGLNAIGQSAVFTLPIVVSGNDDGFARVARQAAHAGPNLAAVYARAESIEPKDVAIVAADERSCFGRMIMELSLGPEKAHKFTNRADSRPFVVPIRTDELVDLGRDVFPHLMAEIVGRPAGFHAVLLVDAEDDSRMSTIPLVELGYKRPVH